jgi:hypothetical protein
MVHNHKDGVTGTGVGADRPHNLTLDEVMVLHRARLLVPPE